MEKSKTTIIPTVMRIFWGSSSRWLLLPLREYRRIGSESAEHFDEDCSRSGPTHFFNHPKDPQSNACLERFNRTVQEQCINLYIDYLDEPDDFNMKLMDYLFWYNTEKPHRGIGNLPPLRYYLDNFLPIPEKSNMLWTPTLT